MEHRWLTEIERKILQLDEQIKSLTELRGKLATELQKDLCYKHRHKKTDHQHGSRRRDATKRY